MSQNTNKHKIYDQQPISNNNSLFSNQNNFIIQSNLLNDELNSNNNNNNDKPNDDIFNLNGNTNNNNNNKESENNQLFDNILKDVIHVSTGGGGEQRTTANANLDANLNSGVQVQEIPFKIKGLNEPTKNLIDYTNLGVVAPLSVLSAQPPPYSDIKLISNFASEANSCINNYTLRVPQKVVFNFNPVI